jgi:putative acetyltransferase
MSLPGLTRQSIGKTLAALMDARIEPGHDTEICMTATFHLRPYRDDDEDASIALWLETWRLAYPSIDFDARVDWWRKRWRDELIPVAQVIVAEHDGMLTGFVTIDDTGYLDQLVVGTTQWGTPLGSALVDEAKRLSPSGVTLKVNADNFRAIRFYERNGFVHDGEDVNPSSKRLILKMKWQSKAATPKVELI